MRPRRPPGHQRSPLSCGCCLPLSPPLPPLPKPGWTSPPLPPRGPPCLLPRPRTPGAGVGAWGRGEEGPKTAASTSVTLSFPNPTFTLSSLNPALQPHPRVNFCPLPSEQCYQAPGGPEDRGLAWVGCHGATQRSQVSTGIGGWGGLGQERRPCDLLSPCFCSIPRGSPQTGGACAQEVWMLR